MYENYKNIFQEYKKLNGDLKDLSDLDLDDEPTIALWSHGFTGSEMVALAHSYARSIGMAACRVMSIR